MRWWAKQTQAVGVWRKVRTPEDTKEHTPCCSDRNCPASTTGWANRQPNLYTRNGQGRLCRWNWHTRRFDLHQAIFHIGRRLLKV
jgi:selenophosphate synthetase-related protein